MRETDEGLTSELYGSVDRVDTAGWDWVRARTAATAFTEPTFLRAVERSMVGQTRLWYALLRDEHDTPVAAAVFCVLRVDLGVLATGRTRRVVEQVRRAVPGALRLPVLFCGLPVSVAADTLLVTGDADRAAVFSHVNGLMTRLARVERCPLLCIREFGYAERDERAPTLAALGWTFAEVPPMNHLRLRYPDLDTYVGGMRAKRRQDVRRSLRKAVAQRVTMVRRRDPAAIRSVYTDRVHQLYLSVLARSEHQLEVLPREFFLALVDELPGRVELMCAEQDGRVVAFNWSLRDRSAVHLLFCGVDYPVNETTDAYFNVMYAELDGAMRAGAAEVYLGQTADRFKARLGCDRVTSHVCVRGRATCLSRVLRYAAGLLFPRPPDVHAYTVFRSTAPHTDDQTFTYQRRVT